MRSSRWSYRCSPRRQPVRSDLWLDLWSERCTPRSAGQKIFFSSFPLLFFLCRLYAFFFLLYHAKVSMTILLVVLFKKKSIISLHFFYPFQESVHPAVKTDHFPHCTKKRTSIFPKSSFFHHITILYVRYHFLGARSSARSAAHALSRQKRFPCSEVSAPVSDSDKPFW